MLKYYRLGTFGFITRSCAGNGANIVSNAGFMRRSLGNFDDEGRVPGVLSVSVPTSDSAQLSQKTRKTLAFGTQAFRGFCTGTASNGSERLGSVNSVGAAKQTRTLGLNEFVRTDQNAEPASETERVPYVSEESLSGHGRKVFIKTYGCQMNVNDTEIAWGILQKNGFEKVDNADESDVILMVTCSVRERAEEKVWGRLEYFKHLKKMRRYDKTKVPLKIGILGCMAERLKKTIMEKEPMVDVICGPDAYRDLPRMLSLTDQGQAAVNVLLSLDETYADVMPVRVNSKGPSAFVSIMRGCDNMCSYCIVPFTRGRERSRPMESILDEIRALSDQGVKEVMLLGQNVNSYRDTSEMTSHGGYDDASSTSNHSKGFTPIYKPKIGGRRFDDLLDQVSAIDPEMRIRFTSPHPKDFPDEVLYLIQERTNICKQLHLPAQSGSSRVLETMRRGYTREAYLQLVQHIRALLPGVSLSSDFIAGFCGETEEDHEATLSLIKLVKYNFAYCFAYSMRQKTRAHHRLSDDVPTEVKNRRHLDLVAAFRDTAFELNRAEIGNNHLVLVEGVSKRTDLELAGRTDGGTKVILPQIDISEEEGSRTLRPINVGDYLAVKIVGASSQVLKGSPLFHSSLQRGAAESETSQMSLERTARLKSR